MLCSRQRVSTSHAEPKTIERGRPSAEEVRSQVILPPPCIHTLRRWFHMELISLKHRISSCLQIQLPCGSAGPMYTSTRMEAVAFFRNSLNLQQTPGFGECCYMHRVEDGAGIHAAGSLGYCLFFRQEAGRQELDAGRREDLLEECR